jgi:hypothetical protein
VMSKARLWFRLILLAVLVAVAARKFGLLG